MSAAQNRPLSLDLLHCKDNMLRVALLISAPYALLGRFLPRLRTVNSVGGLFFGYAPDGPAEHASHASIS
jgi:hypothetical protein